MLCLYQCKFIMVTLRDYIDAFADTLKLSISHIFSNHRAAYASFFHLRCPDDSTISLRHILNLLPYIIQCRHPPEIDIYTLKVHY